MEISTGTVLEGLSPTPDISIVIPAYNEEIRLPATLQKLQQFFASTGWHANTSVLVVDDGSTDATVNIVRTMQKTWKNLDLLVLPHVGKGAAIRNGLLYANGNYIMFCDADMAMPVDQLPRFFPPISPDADIIIGSRELPDSHRYQEPFYRHFMGRMFNQVTQFLVLPGLEDTQCGFKRFTRPAARKLAEHQLVDGMAFDVELLALARHFQYSIAEIPIDWHHDSHSKVRTWQDTLAMTRDVYQIRQRIRHMKSESPISLPMRSIS